MPTSHLLKPKLPKFPRTQTHSLTLSPALFALTLAPTLTPAGRALQYRAALPAGLSPVLFVGGETRVDMDAVFKL